MAKVKQDLFFGKRRSAGVSDTVGQTMAKCLDVKDLVQLAIDKGVPAELAEPYVEKARGGMHLGLIRMQLGNRIRGIFNRKARGVPEPVAKSEVPAKKARKPRSDKGVPRKKLVASPAD